MAIPLVLDMLAEPDLSSTLVHAFVVDTPIEVEPLFGETLTQLRPRSQPPYEICMAGSESCARIQVRARNF